MDPFWSKLHILQFAVSTIKPPTAQDASNHDQPETVWTPIARLSRPTPEDVLGIMAKLTPFHKRVVYFRLLAQPYTDWFEPMVTSLQEDRDDATTFLLLLLDWTCTLRDVRDPQEVAGHVKRPPPGAASALTRPPALLFEQSTPNFGWLPLVPFFQSPKTLLPLLEAFWGGLQGDAGILAQIDKMKGRGIRDTIERRSVAMSEHFKLASRVIEVVWMLVNAARRFCADPLLGAPGMGLSAAATKEKVANDSEQSGSTHQKDASASQDSTECSDRKKGELCILSCMDRGTFGTCLVRREIPQSILTIFARTYPLNTIFLEVLPHNGVCHRRVLTPEDLTPASNAIGSPGEAALGSLLNSLCSMALGTLLSMVITSPVEISNVLLKSKCTQLPHPLCDTEEVRKLFPPHSSLEEAKQKNEKKHPEEGNAKVDAPGGFFSALLDTLERDIEPRLISAYERVIKLQEEDNAERKEFIKSKAENARERFFAKVKSGELKAADIDAGTDFDYGIVEGFLELERKQAEEAKRLDASFVPPTEEELQAQEQERKAKRAGFRLSQIEEALEQLAFAFISLVAELTLAVPSQTVPHLKDRVILRGLCVKSSEYCREYEPFALKIAFKPKPIDQADPYSLQGVSAQMVRLIDGTIGMDKEAQAKGLRTFDLSELNNLEKLWTVPSLGPALPPKSQEQTEHHREKKTESKSETTNSTK